MRGACLLKPLRRHKKGDDGDEWWESIPALWEDWEAKELVMRTEHVETKMVIVGIYCGNFRYIEVCGWEVCGREVCIGEKFVSDKFCGWESGGSEVCEKSGNIYYTFFIWFASWRPSSVPFHITFDQAFVTSLSGIFQQNSSPKSVVAVRGIREVYAG